MHAMTILAVYAAAVNLISFLLMGIDKRNARVHAFRVPEATLFLFAFLGGSVGAILGMQLFRHKTRKRRFFLGLPLLLILQLLFILLFLRLPAEVIFM